MSVAAEPAFSLKIPVLQSDVFGGLLDDRAWREEFQKVRFPYETRILAESQIGPRIWVRLTSYTIGSGGEAGSVWVEIASRRPSPVETVAGRGLLRAFAAISSERRRLLERLLLHFVLLEYTDETARPQWHPPSTGQGIRAALVAAETTAAPAIWTALVADLRRNRPKTVVSLRDTGGTAGLEAFDGFVASPADLGALPRRLILDELQEHWTDWRGRASPESGFAWVTHRIGAGKEPEVARFVSTHLRFGEMRRRSQAIPKRLREGELGVFFPRDGSEAAECAATGLIPVAPGVLWDVSNGPGGARQTSAGYAHDREGAAAYTAIATSLAPERRANFLLAGASAAIVATASGAVS